MKSISKIVAMFLILEMICAPLFALNYAQQFDEPLGQGSGSGMSFRKENLKRQVQPGGEYKQDQNMLNKGIMMTEPSMASLSYQVHILGEVSFPGTYRITASDRLSEVINRAGGINDQGSKRNIQVRRQGEPTKIVDLLQFQLFGNLADNPYLLDNDTIFVPLHGPMVNVVGAVMRPREYELRNEKTLADVLKLAGGESVGAARGVPISIIRFVNSKKSVIEVSQTPSEMAAFAIQNGDVIFVPHMITELNKFDFDLPKLPGDNIFYPSFEDRVFILGGVQSPGAYTFNPYYSLPQYLSLAGGTTKMSTNKISILSPEGEVAKVTKKNRASIIINPGDTVVIGERRIPPEGWVTLFMSIATFGLATTSTVLALQK